jgi:hypothetical protein
MKAKYSSVVNGKRRANIDVSGFDPQKLKVLAREFLHSETFTDEMNDTWVETRVNGHKLLKNIDHVGKYYDGFGWKFAKDSFEAPQVTASEYLEHAEINKPYKEVVETIKSERIRKSKEKLDESVKNFQEKNKDTLMWMKDTMLPFVMQIMMNGTNKLPSDLEGDSGGVINIR